MNKVSSRPGLRYSLDMCFQLTRAFRGDIFKAIKSLVKVYPDMKEALKMPDRTLDELTSGENIEYNSTHDPQVLEDLGYGLVKPMARNFEKDMLDNHSLLNIKEALIEISKGGNVAFVSNHLSELDPTFLYMRLLEVDWDKVQTAQNMYQYEKQNTKVNNNNLKSEEVDLKKVVEQIYVIIGSKVKENYFKDYFAKLVNRVYVFQSKSKENASEQEREQMTKFNRFSLLNLMKMKKKSPQTSVYVFPGGKRARPKIDKKHVSEWDPGASNTLFKALKIDKVLPIGIVGTEDINSPSGIESSTDGIQIKSANVYFRAGNLMTVDPEWDTSAAENIKAMNKKVNFLVTRIKNTY